MAASSTRPGPAGNAPSGIPPDQLRQIIHTSDSMAIRNVLLNLCKLSPALSGAVARGLAPSSSYAQQTIQAYRNKTAASKIKSDPGGTAKYTFQDATKNRPVMPHQPHIKHEVKHEVKPVWIPSDDEDDLLDVEELFKPTPRPSTDSHPSFAAPSSFKSNGGNANVKSEWPSSSRLPLNLARDRMQPANIKTEPTPPDHKCVNCGKPFESENDPCVYHPGRKVVATNDYGDRMSVYNCCRRDVYEPGCKFGIHVAEPAQGLDQLRQLVDRSPTAFNREPKRPRFE